MILTLLLAVLAQEGPATTQSSPATQASERLELPPKREKSLCVVAYKEDLDGHEFKVALPKALALKGNEAAYMLERWKYNENDRLRSFTRTRVLVRPEPHGKGAEGKTREEVQETVRVLWDPVLPDSHELKHDRDGSVHVSECFIFYEKVLGGMYKRRFGCESRTDDGVPCYHTESWDWDPWTRRYTVSIVRTYKNEKGIEVKRGHTEIGFSFPPE